MAGRPPDDERSDHRLLDRTFDVTVILKGLDGLLEAVGGILLLLISPARMDHLARTFTRQELSEDPHDFLARNILHASASLNHSRGFAAFYLLAHGVVKIVLVGALLKDKRWAYPATLVFLTAFIVYQLYRIALRASAGLILLTLFDLLMVWLVWREYRTRYPPLQPVPDRVP